MKWFRNSNLLQDRGPFVSDSLRDLLGIGRSTFRTCTERGDPDLDTSSAFPAVNLSSSQEPQYLSVPNSEVVNVRNLLQQETTSVDL